MSVGPSELVVIVLVVLLLFGSRRLADLGKGLGDGIRGFKRAIADEPDVAAAEKAPAETPKDPPQLTGRVASPAELGKSDSDGAAASVAGPESASPEPTRADVPNAEKSNSA